MGTLFEQLPRNEQLPAPGYRVVVMANELSELFDISFNAALKCIELDHAINDYDNRDEQMAGFGELFKELIEVLESANSSD